MTRDFLDVFSGFGDKGENASFFKDVKINRMSTNKKHDVIRLYLDFPTLIPKRRIRALESQIRKDYFGKEEVRVVIIEHFSLSGQFSPEVLYDSYKDSIFEEIEQYSAVLFSLFSHATLDFDEAEHLLVSLEDTIVAHERERELHEILDKIFCDRCGQTLMIDFAYKERQESRFIRESDLRIKNAVEQITSKMEAPAENTGEEMMLSERKPKQQDAQGKEQKQVNGAQKQPDSAAQSKPINGQKAKASNASQKNGQKTRTNASRPQQRRGTNYRKSSNPDLLYGRDFEEEAVPIREIVDEVGEVVIRGEVLFVEDRTLQNDKILFMFTVTDDTDTIRVKMFLNSDRAMDVMEAIRPGGYIKLKGIASLDRFDHDIAIGSVRGIVKIPGFRKERMDLAPVKRVELHCHTKMSDMDGVSDVKDIIACARKWGHKAIAITDHGVVAAFPDADHSVKGEDDIKVIYGTEAYLVDDTKQIAQRVTDESLEDSFVIFDLETTGLNARQCKIIEIGAVKYENGKITERFSEFVNPGMPIPYRIVELTSITDDMVAESDPIETVLPRFHAFCGDAVLVAHNADFDCGCITAQCEQLGEKWDFAYMDTIPMAKHFLPQLKSFKLDRVANVLSVPLGHHHRAVDDAECTAHIFEKLADMARERGIHTLRDLNEAGKMDTERIKKERPHHCILLAKNDLGRINLYRLVSESHINYFRQKPKLPKSLVEQYREGLIIGSACSAGEIYDAILTGKDDNELNRLVQFYDYLEIQPVGNNSYLLSDDKYGTSTIEDLRNINRRIVALGKEFGKPVAATCDVHFLHPEDEIYRRIIQSNRKFADADDQAPLYLHTTEEMLEEFAYLGQKTAEEVVIRTPGRIADMCERIHPTRPDKCPPVIADSDTMLREICFTKAHEIYGEELPEIVTERLERELTSIIGNGYAVMYIIAQKLVWKSVEDGYLVGSRGSVGSSFAATMAGITEVNPLSPHYICANPDCHYVDFDSDEVKEYAGRAGCDMPDKLCPRCGKPLKKEGFDIPFETFLGFKGNKEPDIDLNFSGDYQNKAHRYTEVIFGEGQTFRAGTIGTLADKTAFGYIKHYFEEKGESRRTCEIDRLVQGCVGIRRTTGQHPGGIIVLPTGEDIYSFTPIQHPANKDIDIVTTHFDYHSIDSNLLKLDILGHDDPTMIRRLEDLTGLSAQEIPLDDAGVMSLFKNTEALGVTPDDLWGGCDMGTLGVPEFGTDFAMGMLKDAKPTEFSDLVRIAGLAHGTDVWLGNAQTLIQEGKATISTAICTRDDIMTYLIGKGMDSEESFKIMEAVRKGMVAKGKCDSWADWKQDMIDHDVPDWYIWSCEKIKYMFPKAHAAAYVMMAWRIAWFKIYEPLAYYAAYFSIRAKFDYEKMGQGAERLQREMKALQAKEAELKKQKKKMTATDKDMLMDMRSVQEMYARGFSVLPIDLYQSDARYFKIVDGKLLPPFTTIDGMGDKAAETLAVAAAEGEFLSRDDLKNRGKVSATVVDTMYRLGIIADLPESDQLSLFDFQ
ncbi:MAG: PolC-type DNA polymerase III [Lachnospiraceae bacterium]|nr:PolC-type DNA polymerase III [Lachnospiraceae bacterium]